MIQVNTMVSLSDIWGQLLRDPFISSDVSFSYSALCFDFSLFSIYLLSCVHLYPVPHIYSEMHMDFYV